VISNLEKLNSLECPPKISIGAVENCWSPRPLGVMWWLNKQASRLGNPVSLVRSDLTTTIDLNGAVPEAAYILHLRDVGPRS
jgi:hypothetical protein